ncbi:MAG TPA: hypothetical protein VI815_00405 [Candidatus Nanoarchaeia archaeon]|nr:hypothetical protein [Candidatus Nanoarchaeia archaeon]
MVKEFLKELNGKRVEGELIRTFLYSFIVSIAIIGIAYFVSFRKIPGFIDNYGSYLLLASISIALITSLIRQVRAYKEFACMSGMMIGMTAGMIAGFSIGLYLGATNGMFIGSVLGMLVGIFMGVWMGKCCGVMGIMEGIMAGFMGGLMGAMTAVMMINDNIKLAVIIVSIVSYVILILLNYMIYKEMKENERQRKEDHTITVFLSIILIFIVTWFMVYGPRSSLFG